MGSAIALELSHVHVLTHTDPTYQALCAVSDRINCETVALSPYSVWLGVPVSVWGVLAYGVFAALAAATLLARGARRAAPAGLLLALASASLLASMGLAYVSFAKIDSLCLYCTALYVVNAALFGLTLADLIIARIDPRSALVRDLRSLARLERPLITIVGSAVFLAVVLLSVWPPYWQPADWQDLQRLPAGVTEDGEPWIGAASPVVTIVEFTDYECPFCRRAHRQIRRSLAEHADRVRLVHKHFPLDHACNPAVKQPFHRRACELSRFVACAGKQGRFWAANDAVFSALDSTRAQELDLGRLGVRLGLDVPVLRACMTEKAVEAAIRADLEDGVRRKVSGTPTYLVGDLRLEGGVPEHLLATLLADQQDGRAQ